MKILLAIDDSKFSVAATQAVAALFRPEGTEVRVLHVVDLIPSITRYAGFGGSYPDIEAVRRETLKHSEELVARAAHLLRGAGLNVTTSVEEGDPKTIIVDRAAEWKADLIVVGSHGRKGLERFFLGSVAEGVARHAACAVQIVRLPAERLAKAA